MKYIRFIALLAIIHFSAISNAQNENLPYDPKLPQVGLSVAKTKLKNILENIVVSNKIVDYNSSLEDVTVFDDRIEMTYKTLKLIGKNKYPTTIYFSDILNDNIVVLRLHDPWPVGYDRLEFRNFYFFGFHNTKSDAKDLANYLFYFQHRLIVYRYDSLISIFKPIAKKYCALKLKPQVSEEQRKYIVQANSFNEQKNYYKAIESYIKAIEVDQTAYPTAYTNLALLSAQINKFDAAIYYMKKYLMLEPEAADARGAQDKIYLWEAQIVN